MPKCFIFHFVKNLCWLLLPVALLAQKHEVENVSSHFLNGRKCISNFHAVAIGQENADNIRSKLPLLTAQAATDFVLESEQASLAGRHYSFVQFLKGLEVYQSQVRVSTNGKGTVTAVLDNSVHQPVFVHEKLKAVSALPFIQPLLNGKQLHTQKEMWLPDADNKLRNVYVLKTEGAHGSWSEVIADNHNIIFERDLNMYFAPPDSTVKGFVFLPDPLTTAGKVYGGIYVDNADADAQWLTDERKQIDFTADFDNGTFRLRNSFVRISDYDLPSLAVATSTTPEFNFTRSQSGFEQVSVMYHISEFGKYVQQMGFNNANVLLEADAHAVNGADNSYFAFNYNPMRLYFGIGGVDDAEDADVVIHEYSHFLSYRASPNSNVGPEREALDEAFCDYNAASYSRAINAFNWGRVYNWDGHNEFWNGRVVNSSKIYPANMGSSIYRNGEIWSSMLMQLWSDIGKAVTDKLIFQAHFSFAQNMSFLDAANLLLQADQQLFGGQYYCPITQRLHERGLLPAGKTLCPIGIDEVANELPVQVFGSENWLVITSGETLWNATVEVFDASGRSVYTAPMHDGTHRMNTQGLSAGIYIIKVKADARSKVMKWLKKH